MKCDCPFCPIEEANVQMCAVYIRFTKRGSQHGINYAHLPDEYSHLKEQFVMLIQRAFHAWKLKIGDENTERVGSTRFSVKRLRKYVFILCVHANVDDSDTDTDSDTDEEEGEVGPFVRVENSPVPLH
jgi:hypothetical protein